MPPASRVGAFGAAGSRALAAGIGHNNGPPMATRWGLHCWTRARAKAWATPGPEVVRLRLRRAAELGLTYNQLTGILMEVGRTPVAVVFGLAGTLVERAGADDVPALDGEGRVRLRPGVGVRLAALVKPAVLVLAGAGPAEAVARWIAQVAAASGGRIDGWRMEGRPMEGGRTEGWRGGSARPAAALDLLAGHGVSPRDAFLVGEGEADRDAGRRLAAFLPATTYFAQPSRGRAS